MQVTAGLWLSVASAAVSLVVAGYARRQDVPGAAGVVAFGLAAAVWAGGNAVQVAATSLDAKLLAVDVQYVGIAVLPVAWFAFAAEYTGRGEWVNRRALAWLSVVPAATLALVLTNDLHGLVRASATVESAGGVQRLDRTFGPAFWLAVAYANLVNAAGTVMLLAGMLRVGSEYRRQTAVVLVGATIPWVANLAYLGGATVVEPEAFLGATTLAFGYAVARYDRLELVPVARNRVFEELDDGVLVLGRDGHVADYNAAAERLLGVDLAVGDVFDDVAPEAVADAAATDAGDAVAVERDGETRWVTVRTDDVSDDRHGVLVLLRDVTDAERQRARLDQENERLERVADTISHDLKNPLGVAFGYLELAEQDGDPEAFERLRGALDRMEDIVDGTLRMARAGRGSVDETGVSLAAVARRAWSNVPTDGASLDVDTDVGPVRADPSQLESLFENVFRNSVEHSGEHVHVTVRATPDGFVVADDGPGIPEVDHRTVFERGYTTSSDGTGLGLAIVRDVADAHGWTVELGESDSGGVRVAVHDVARAASPRSES